MLSFFLFTLLPVAHAIPQPVPKFVYQADEVTVYDSSAGGSGSFQTNYTLAFQVAPNDPDQTNGSWTYRVYFDGILTLASFAPIPQRPGWLKATNQFAGPTGGDPSDYTLHAVAYDGTNESAYSCALDVDFRDATLAGSHAQCGDGVDLRAPSGILASVPTRGTIAYNITRSPDDINDDFQYIGYLTKTTHKHKQTTPRAWAFTETGPSNANDTREMTLYVADADVRELHKLDVVARDPYTGQQSMGHVPGFPNVTSLLFPASCVATADPANVGALTGCGWYNGTRTFGGTPSFPFVDLAAVQVGTGWSQTAVLAFLGVVLVVGLTVGAFALGGAPGAFVAGLLSVAFLTLLNVLPVWVLVLVFMGGAAVAVLAFRAPSPR